MKRCVWRCQETLGLVFETSWGFSFGQEMINASRNTKVTACYARKRRAASGDCKLSLRLRRLEWALGDG